MVNNPLIHVTQWLALAAVGGRVDSPSKWEKPKTRKVPEKRNESPPSAARFMLENIHLCNGA
jgi:hypothetical protein